MKRLLITVIMLCVIISSCSSDKDDAVSIPDLTCDDVVSTYAGSVKGLIETRCAAGASCHGTGSFNGPGALTSYQQIKDAANRIRPAVHSGLMPKGSTLTEREKKSITCWIDAGAPNN